MYISPARDAKGGELGELARPKRRFYGYFKRFAQILGSIMLIICIFRCIVVLIFIRQEVYSCKFMYAFCICVSYLPFRCLSFLSRLKFGSTSHRGTAWAIVRPSSRTNNEIIWRPGETRYKEKEKEENVWRREIFGPGRIIIMEEERMGIIWRRRGKEIFGVGNIFSSGGEEG